MLQLQSLLRAFFYAFHTQNTLCCVSLIAGIIWNFHIHRADPFTLSTGGTFPFICLNAEKRKVTHRLQKNCNWADILAKGSVILTFIGDNNSNCIVEDISNDETPPHNFPLVWNLKDKEQADKYERSSDRKSVV